MARHAQSLFLFPVATLVPTPPAAIVLDADDADDVADTHLSAALRPVPGKVVIDFDTFSLLAGPPSLELVDACRRAPFHAAAAIRDIDGIWQYVAPRGRAAAAAHHDVRVVYLDSAHATEIA